MRLLRRSPLIIAIAVVLSLLAATAAYAIFTDTDTITGTISTASSTSCATDYATRISATASLSNYWKFNEGSGSTATATTGGTNGTYHNVNLGQSSPKNQVSGSSVYIGSSAYVDFGDIDDFTNTTAFSMDFWIERTAGVSSQTPIITKSSTSTPKTGWELLLNPDDTLTFNRWTSGTATSVVSQSTLVDGLFSRVTVTYDGSNLRIYFGDELDAAAASTNSIANTTASMRVGQWSNTTSSTLPANIDELAIYSTALTGAQVIDHNVRCDYANAVATTAGLQNYWRMDDGTGTSVYDSGPNKVTGTASNVKPGQPSGLPSNTYYSDSFSYSSASSISMGNVDSFTGTSSFTVEAWIKPTTAGLSNWSRIVDKGAYTTGREGWDLLITDDTHHAACERWKAGSYTGADSGAVVSTTAWTHVACTYDGTNIRMYINGVLKDTEASSLSINATSTNLHIGADFNSTSNMDGGIDDVSIYNTALSGSTISNQYAER